MNVQAHIKDDDSFTEIPNVKWHPAFERHVTQTETTTEPAGLWTTVEAISAHLDRINKIRQAYCVEPRKLKTGRECADLIDYASAPVSVYSDTDDHEPWKHDGTLVKEIHYAGSDSFWNEH